MSRLRDAVIWNTSTVALHNDHWIQISITNKWPYHFPINQPYALRYLYLLFCGPWKLNVISNLGVVEGNLAFTLNQERSSCYTITLKNSNWQGNPKSWEPKMGLCYMQIFIYLSGGIGLRRGCVGGFGARVTRCTLPSEDDMTYCSYHTNIATERGKKHWTK